MYIHIKHSRKMCTSTSKNAATERNRASVEQRDYRRPCERNEVRERKRECETKREGQGGGRGARERESERARESERGKEKERERE